MYNVEIRLISLFTLWKYSHTSAELAAKFIRLLTITKKIYGVQLGDDWSESIREKLKSISNPNGLLFTAVLIYNTKQDNKSADQQSADGDDTLDWFDLVNTDTWLESMEQQYLTTVRDPRPKQAKYSGFSSTTRQLQSVDP